MVDTKTLVLSAVLGAILIVGQVVGQTSSPKAQDELQYKDNNEDANSIDDSMSPPSQDDDRRPRQFGNGLGFGANNNSPQERQNNPLGFPSFLPSLPLFGANNFPAFGRGGGLFGGLTDSFAPAGRPSLFDDVYSRIRDHTRNFERAFSDLAKQAGEGERVRYFNRNGVEYQETCTTKRLTPESSRPTVGPSYQPDNVLPLEEDKVDQLPELEQELEQEQKQPEPQQLPKPQSPPASQLSDKSDRSSQETPETHVTPSS